MRIMSSQFLPFLIPNRRQVYVPHTDVKTNPSLSVDAGGVELGIPSQKLHRGDAGFICNLLNIIVRPPLVRGTTLLKDTRVGGRWLGKRRLCCSAS